MWGEDFQHLLVLVKIVHLDYVLDYVIAELVFGKVEAVFDDLLAESFSLTGVTVH